VLWLYQGTGYTTGLYLPKKSPMAEIFEVSENVISEIKKFEHKILKMKMISLCSDLRLPRLIYKLEQIKGSNYQLPVN
jgi:hypothetical protein